ncbi:MAG: hypothetical protein Q9227_003791 [Pyrenula ochraceoflavens]
MDPPPPPPHGANNQNNRSGLPDGHYDIFVIPPHSSGSGFLYLPSLQPHRNSFLAGVASTMLVFLIWVTVIPVVKEWFASILAGGGPGVLMLLLAVGVACWAFGKTQGEGTATGDSAGTGGSGASTGSFNTGSAGVPPKPSGTAPRPSSTWSRPQTGGATGATGAAKTSWEKAREETRKKEEERRKAEELKKKREELEKQRQQQREKEAREREARERKEKLEKAREEVRAREEARAKEEAKAKAEAPKTPSPKKPPNPTAKTETDDDAYSFRPYDRPKQNFQKANSSASFFSASESQFSYAHSATTARTTPPPSHRGPYNTKDPDKIIIKGVYSFNNAFMRKPIAQLISGQGKVTDGLILRITTEGLFIDDDIRQEPQREWDVKAWTMKLAESAEMLGLHVLRAHIRDQEGKKYVFIIDQAEGWKVAVGLQRLRRGSQVRALAVSGMPMNETKAMLDDLGWI